jgi:radical SAM superfamily enzyme YgiQ (UPF0313 family)
MSQQRDLKILFVNPCLRRKPTVKLLPVGLAYVMTYVQEAGYEFDLLDVDINEYDDDYVETYVRDNEYDVILYGSIVTHYAWIKWLTRTIKKHRPETKVVVGNSVGGSCVNVFMNNVPADVVVKGEGELGTLDVLNAYRDGTPLADVEGIAYRTEGGEVLINPIRKACDINSLPFPNWELFETDRYFSWSELVHYGDDDDDPAKPKRVMPVSTARGCAFRCTFCHFVFIDDPYRIRDPQSVLAEIRRNIDRYGANYINFWDDLSFASLKQVEAMVEAIEASDLEFEWSAAIRTDLFGRDKRSRPERVEIARRMKAAGCTTVGFSLESANAEILDMMNKKVKPEFFTDQVEILREAGLPSTASVVFGYPIETEATIEETFDMCLEARIYPSIGYLLPLPGTPMYEYAKTHGFIEDEDRYLMDITERQDLCINMTSLSEEEVMGFIKAGASRLNRTLEIGLDEDRLIKTGGYKKHTNRKNQLQDVVIDPDDMRRNENDFSFNYSRAEFDLNTGTDG